MWSGKSTLLAEAALEVGRQGADVIAYFLSRREADADSRRFLSAVIPQLAHLLGQAPPLNNIHEFRHLWAQLVERNEQTQHPFVLIVDGLDEDLLPEGQPSVASLLPVHLGTYGHVIVASRFGDYFLSGVPATHPLRSVTPMYLPPSPDARAVSVLAKNELATVLRDRHSTQLALEIVSVMAVAGGRLCADDIAGILSGEAEPEPALSAAVARVLERDLVRCVQVSSSEHSLRYHFSHSALMEEALANAAAKIAPTRRSIYKWINAWRQRHWRASPADASPPEYLFDTYPFTITDGMEALHELVSDVDWIIAALACTDLDIVIAAASSPNVADKVGTPAFKIRGLLYGQRLHIRRQTSPRRSFIVRQLCLEALSHGYSDLADQLRERLVDANPSGLIPVWSTRRSSQAFVANIGFHSSWVQSAARVDSNLVVTGGDDARVCIWDVSGRQFDLNIVGQHSKKIGHSYYQGGGRPRRSVENGGVSAVAVLGNRRFLSAGGDGEILLWDLENTGNPEVIGHHPGEIGDLLVLTDERVVSIGPAAEGHLRNSARVWNPSGGSDGSFIEVGPSDSHINSATVVGDNLVVTSCVHDDAGSNIVILDCSGSGPSVSTVGRLEESEVLHMATVSPTQVVLSDGDGAIWLMLLEHHPRFIHVGDHGDRVLSVAAFSDGRAVTGGTDGRILLWETSLPGAQPREVGRHDAGVTALSVLDENRIVSGGEDGLVRVWKTTSALLRQRNPNQVQESNVQFMPDGRLASLGIDGRVRIWDPKASSPGVVVVGSFPDEEVESVTRLRDGRVLMEDSYTGDRLAIGPPPKGSPLEHFEDPVRSGGQDEFVTAYALVGPDGLVTGGFHGGLRYRSLDNIGTEPVEFGSHDGPVEDLIAAAGNRVISVGYDGLVRSWHLPRRSWIQRIQHKIGVRDSLHATQSTTLIRNSSTNNDHDPIVAITHASPRHVIGATRYNRYVLIDTYTSEGRGIEIGERLPDGCTWKSIVELKGRLYSLHGDTFGLREIVTDDRSSQSDACAPDPSNLLVTASEGGIFTWDKSLLTLASGAYCLAFKLSATVDPTSGALIIATTHYGHGITLWTQRDELCNRAGM